ncbi:MAG: hypothetical protein LBV29_04740, partial [Azoarcus sp.]|nr:hypothetical protein [Azoarcus sp.]
MSKPVMIGLGIFFSSLIAILIYMLYAGVGMVWRHVDENTALRYFLSLVTVILLLSAIFSIAFLWKSSFSGAKIFSESYKSEALIVDIFEIRSIRGAGKKRLPHTGFGLVLEIKREDGSLYETKVSFTAPERYNDLFRIGKTIIIDVSSIDP